MVHHNDNEACHSALSEVEGKAKNPVHALTRAIFVLFISIVLLDGITASANQGKDISGRPEAVATRLEGSLVVDGWLSEPAWSSAPDIGPLTQREPQPGTAPSERSVVKVLYDQDHLYIGATLYDAHPDRIVASTMERDAELNGDDRFVVVLDTFLDRRSGYFFIVNPAGAKTDGLISSNDSQPDIRWDGLWEGKTRRTPDGWSVEMAIPFKTLSFKVGLTTWGFNVERRIQRRQETDRWAAPRLDVRFTQVAEAGLLTGLDRIEQGLGLTVRPFGVAGHQNTFHPNHITGTRDAGGDIFKNLTPNLVASLSVKTDFAETEVDTRQINLTRFPLFFPEKRGFFLEGDNLFQAGPGPGRDVIPFFSRRVGLFQDQEVPIDVAAKLTGRVGSMNIGVLDAQMGNTDTTSATNLFVARVSRNLWTQSSAGMIVTNGDPAGLADNRLIGGDFTYATSRFHGEKNFFVSGWSLFSDHPSHGSQTAYGGRIDYPNDLWDISLNAKHIGDAFVPALGFVPRSGVNIYQVGIAYQPRPRGTWLRQLFFEFDNNFFYSLDGRLESWRMFTAPFNTRTESGEHLEWNWIPQFESLPGPFEVADGVIIPPGRYTFHRFRTEVNTANKRPWKLDLSVRYGWFYTGTLTQVESGLTLKPGAALQLEVTAEHNLGRLPQGNFNERLYVTRVRYSFSPDLSLSSLVQYDSVSQNLGTNTRLRWIIRPGNELVAIYNRGWNRVSGTLASAFEKSAVKLQWAFRP